MGRRPALKIEEIQEALRKSGGFINKTAEMLGVTGSCISNRLARSKVLRDTRREVEESLLDLAESKLIEGIKSGDKACIFFYLKCKGKHRGYIEKQVIQADVHATHDAWIRKLNEPK